MLPDAKLLLSTADCVDLANSKRKVLSFGEFLTKLWSAIQVQYACTAGVVLVIHIDHDLIRNSPSAQHFPFEFARSMHTAVRVKVQLT